MSHDAILARSSSIIYQPGGTASDLIVTSWTTVQKFIAARQGSVIVYVDDSITSPALVPGGSGVTQCSGRVELRTFGNNGGVLQIENGATLDNLWALTAMELRCNPTGATPSLTFTGAVSGTGALIVKDFGFVSNASTATTQAISIPVGESLELELNEGSIILNAPAVPLIAVPATSTLGLFAVNGSEVSENFATGAGTVLFDYDNATASEFLTPGTPPALPGLTGTYTATNLDNIWAQKPIDAVTFNAPAIGDVPTFNADGTWHAVPPTTGGSEVFMQFTTSATNVFAAFVALGVVSMTVSGFGGGGGAGGGAGGETSPPNLPGPGGGGGGGALNQSMVIEVDLSHQIDVVVGAGGVNGTGGAAGAPGSAGGNGAATYLIDQTAATPVVLAAFSGASGGSEGIDLVGTLVAGLGGASFTGSGSFFQQLSNIVGFVAAGGPGSLTGSAATPGNNNVSAIGTSAAAPLWSGGTFGASPVGDGGGGGGGGAGVGGNGGNGGNGGVGAPGSPGGSGGANTGAGGGGGGGGNTGQAGGNGGTGGSGLLNASFLS